MEKYSLPRMYELLLMQVRADRSMRVMVANQVESQRLTMMEWLTLGVISSGLRSGLSMSKVAVDLGVSLPQVTVLVSSLIELKFVKQQILASDHRGRQVHVTLKGKRVLNKLESAVAKTIRIRTKEIPSNRLQAYIQTVEQLYAPD